MMKTIFTTLCISIATILAAQTSTDAVFNAPIDNNPFHSANSSTGSVNTYTGRADISIPLYNINFGGLEIPIKLQYNPEGIQVDQYASEVGLGWTLSSVGEIYKEVNGNYEDNEGRDNWKAYLRMLDQATFVTDFPDYYTINTPNLSGKFFIDREFKVREIEGLNTANINFVRSQPLQDEALKYGVIVNRKRIQDCPMPPAGPYAYYYLFTMAGDCNQYTPGNDYDTQQVKINKDKFTYTFSEIEHIAITTTTKDVIFRGSSEGQSSTTMSFNTGLKLTEIKDNTTKNVLQVNYKPLARINGSDKYDKVWDKLIRRVDNGYETTFFRAIKEYDVTTKETYLKKLPSKIKTNDVEVIFNYENAREDKITKNMVFSEIPLAPEVEYVGPIWGMSTVNPLVKEPLLKSMQIKNNLGQIVMQYTFIYGYFDSGCSNADVCKRLKLMAVEKGYGENNLNKETYKLDYYEDINLPKITSLNKDVFGFKSDIAESSIKDSYGFPIRPFLFQYIENRNNINFSYFSPLKVPALNPVTIPGQFEQGIAGFENIRAWTLKSIKYPTQSVQSFIYEPHEFTWKGTKIKGGGLRIKEISLIDPVINKTLTTQYSYGDGQVSSLPMVTGDEDFASGTPPKSSISRSYSTVINKSKGSYVVYPNSRKTDPDGGYSDYKYSSYTEYPEVQAYQWLISGNNVNIDLDSYLFSKTSLASKMFNYDYLRGNILNTKLYDKQGNLVKETINTYSTTEYPGPSLVEPNVYRGRNLYYPIASTYDANFVGSTPQYLHYLIKRNNLSNIKEKDYLPGGIVERETTLTYTDRFNLLKTVTSSGPVNSDTRINNYAFESTDPLISTNVDYEQIKLGYDKKNGTEEVEKTKTVYSTINGLVVPAAIYTFDYGANDWYKTLSFDMYDSKGNILQITGPNGPAVMLWGYNQSKAIATIEGATYGQVMQAFGLDPLNNSSYLQLEIIKKSNLDIDDNTENQFLAELSAFRSNSNLKNFQITTDVYDPLVGLKIETGVSGLSAKNIYDSSNRISKVLDKDGRTVSEYKYNYAASRYYNTIQSKTFAKYCGSSAFGSTHVYTVPENSYSSTIGQADADNQATNDINANGQNYANSIGTCTPFSCSITPGPGINWNYGTIGMYPGSGLNYRIQMQYVFNSSMNWQSGNGVLVGKIVGNCLTPNVRTGSSYSSGVWGITVQPNGEMYVKFMPGATFVLPPNNTVITLDFALPTN